eukprot:TRINITY_DN692_c2_g1_i1.p1 TRINITY_DN692_c2_g1~~TRINITY_DN692_c2_g1_i1.p1  ORF type:complete len:239 (+),score=51.88 TRINITY_DN692_c2_g1_i1:53-769(+)
MSVIGRKIRATLGLKIQRQSLKDRVTRFFKGEKEEKKQDFRASAGPAQKLRMQSEFRKRTGIKTELDNPLEPEYYKSLPDWLRADGAYAPLEIGKIIFYLLIPIFAIVMLGSRNFTFIQRVVDYTGEYYLKAFAPTYEEQVVSWKKIDQKGLISHYGDNIPVPGSSLARQKYEERMAADDVAPKSNDAPAEYFRIMSDLRKQQLHDSEVRGIIGDEANQIVKESNELFVRAPGQKELF